MRLLFPLIGLALVTVAAGCSAELASRAVVAEPIVALDPGQPTRTRFGALEFRGGLRLSSADKEFGGWSAARLDGDLLTAVNDVGHWLRLRLRHQAGRLAGLQADAGGPLAHLNAKPIGDNKKMADSEGLTRWRDGYVVSFERRHRLWFYGPDLAACPTALDAPAGLAALDDNSGIEAITALADGRLLLLAEEGGAGWIGTPGAWHGLTWTVTEDFKPTDAVLLPTGAVVVLERRFSILGGVGARLSLVPAEEIRPDARLAGRELLRLEAPMAVDNFEGIAVGRGSAGETMLYLLSDDNFSPLQATLLLAFALAE